MPAARGSSVSARVSRTSGGSSAASRSGGARDERVTVGDPGWRERSREAKPLSARAPSGESAARRPGGRAGPHATAGPVMDDPDARVFQGQLVGDRASAVGAPVVDDGYLEIVREPR